MNSSVFINPLSDIIRIVPSGASLNISGFILFLEKIMEDGTKKKTKMAFAANFCENLASFTKTILETICFPFQEIIMGSLFGTAEISLLSILNTQWAENFFSSETNLKLSKKKKINWH
jgi:hypothetical protein